MPFLALLESLVTFKNLSPGLLFQDLAEKIQMHFCSSASEGSDCQSHLEDRGSHLFSPSYSSVSYTIWELGGINIAFVSLDKNKMLHMLFCISGILRSSVWGHSLFGWKTEWEYLEYVKFVIWDRIIHVCKEMEELYILTSAHFKFMSQSTQKIESKATERKAYLCTLFCNTVIHQDEQECKVTSFCLVSWVIKKHTCWLFWLSVRQGYKCQLQCGNCQEHIKPYLFMS